MIGSCGRSRGTRRPGRVMKTVGECVCRVRLGLVAAARRDGAAETSIVGRHGLERVVGLREQRLVRGRGGVGAVGVELRQPVAVQVRLVADDHDPVERRDGCRRRPRRTARSRSDPASVERCRLRAEAASPSRGRCIPESFAAVTTFRRTVVSVVRDGGVARRPDLGDPDRVEAGEAREVHLRLRLHEARRADARPRSRRSARPGPPACAGAASASAAARPQTAGVLSYGTP